MNSSRRKSLTATAGLADAVSPRTALASDAKAASPPASHRKKENNA
jgi:hypothetical protein